LRKEEVITEADLADTVAAFYDSAARLELWPAAGERLSRLLDASVIMSGMGTAPSRLSERVVYSGPTPSSLLEHAAFHAMIDPYLAAAQVMLPAEAHLGIPGQEILNQRVSWHSESYTNSRHGLGHLLDARTRFSDGVQAAFGLYRPETMAPFGEKERRIAAALLPHLWRALELQRRLHSCAEVAAPGTLDALAQAMVIVDAASRVTFANIAAVRMAEAADGGLRFVRFGPASRSDLVLSATHRDDAARLARTVCAVARLGSPGGALRLRQSGGGRGAALAVLVSPVPTRSSMPGVRPSTTPGLALGLALVIATDPSRRVPPSAAMLSEVFGLSRGETAVAAALAGGHSAEEVARARGTSLETVRSQIRSILSKTGAANLRDLERMLASLPTAGLLSPADGR
jgi:DNA-binding CsgD family transcriptional regulator